jgi:RNase P/RNase MRP subunit p29
MKRVLALLVVIFFMPVLVFAGSGKTYQVTGRVMEVTDNMIAVEKGTERWEIARDQDTKVTGNLKVGAMVTIEYRMTATKVEAKEEKKKK